MFTFTLKNWNEAEKFVSEWFGRQAHLIHASLFVFLCRFALDKVCCGNVTAPPFLFSNEYSTQVVSVADGHICRITNPHRTTFCFTFVAAWKFEFPRKINCGSAVLQRSKVRLNCWYSCTMYMSVQSTNCTIQYVRNVQYTIRTVHNTYENKIMFCYYKYFLL